MDRSARLALAHDYLLTLRGAERVFAEIADCWPRADIFTTVYSEAGTGGRFARRNIQTSYIQRLRPKGDSFRRLLPLYPRAVEHLDVGSYDVLVTSSSAFAHGIRPSASATHVCYCHNPFRYVWHERELALSEVPRLVRPLLDRSLESIRRWDLRASRRVTSYIANSALVQARIADFYGRDSTVVHPPVDVDRFSIGTPRDYFLIVSQLVPHKRVEVALAAARRAGVRIKVVGGGPELERLIALYGDTAQLLGRVPDAELPSLYAGARAVVVPTVEEFGISAVEAQAAGRPVLGIRRGGTAETVLESETGVLVDEGTEEQFAEAMRYVDFHAFDPEVIRENSLRFAPERFRERFMDEVMGAIAVSDLAEPVFAAA